MFVLVYHEISNCFSDLTKSKTRTGVFLHHELGGNTSRNLKDAVTKEVKFIEERGNPYELTTNPKLHNFTSGQFVSEESTAKLLKYFEHGQEQYEKFRNERFVTRTKKLSDTLTKVILPKFGEKKQKPKTNQQLVKSTAKRIGEAQKQIEIARERGISTGEILSYDHLNENILFVEDLTAKPNKK